MKIYGTFVASSLLAALALTPSAADAAQGHGHWYATGTLGAASASASFDPGLLAGGAVGYAFSPSWRVEGELDGEGATDGRIKADHEPGAAPRKAAPWLPTGRVPVRGHTSFTRVATTRLPHAEMKIRLGEP